MIEPKPALLTLKKRGENARVMFFESHIDALDTAGEMLKRGWRWQMDVVEVYRHGEKPKDIFTSNQMTMFEADN